MAWRIHLTNQAIQSLNILHGKPPILAAWTRNDRVHYYDLETGDLIDDKRLDGAPSEGRRTHAWYQYINTLIGPEKDMFLPVVRTRRTEIHTSSDGQLRLYRVGDNKLYLEADGVEERLDTAKAERFIALDLDRSLGVIAALDQDARLHIYQQNIRIGEFDIGLSKDPYPRASVIVTQGGGAIFATDGQQIVLVDSGGQVKKQIPMHYRIGRMACSVSGALLLTSDVESGVIRAYNGKDLSLTHQRFAIDLVAEASQVQLMADLPPLGTAISALAAYRKGIFAFAMSGVIAVTDISFMDQLPRPQTLF